MLTIVALTVLLCTGPLFERRRHTCERRAFVLATAGVVALLLVARTILRLALGPLVIDSLASPLTLMVDAVLLAIFVWLTLDVIARRRVGGPRLPLLRLTRGTVARLVSAYALGGAMAAGLLWAYERVLQSNRRPLDHRPAAVLASSARFPADRTGRQPGAAPCLGGLGRGRC